MFKQGDIVEDPAFGITGVLLESFMATNKITGKPKLSWKMLVMANNFGYDKSQAGDIVIFGDKYLKDNYNLVVDND